MGDQLNAARAEGVLTLSELQIGEAIRRTLAASADLLQGPQATANIPTAVGHLKHALKEWERIRQPNPALAMERSILGSIAKDKELTAGILDELLKASASLSDVGAIYSLFEIDNSTGATILREVE